MNSLPLWLLIVGLALVYAGSDSDSDSDESKEKHHYKKRGHHHIHNHPVYPHYYGGLHGPQLTGYFPPQINYPPPHFHGQQHPQPYDFKQHPFYPQLPGYHQHPQHQQRPDGFQHPPAYPWLPPTATNIPMGYYPPQAPSSSSSSSATSVINQQPFPVTSTQGQASNPSSSSSSNSSATINQGTSSVVTEAPYPTHNPNHDYEALREKSPGEYVYTLSNPDSKARSNQPECGENEVCNI